MTDDNFGPALFSRAGKSSTQRIQMLKKTASVLTAEQPKMPVTYIPQLRSLKKEEMAKAELDDLISKELVSIQSQAALRRIQVQKLEKQAHTAAFKAIGREGDFIANVGYTSKRKEENPPCGHYNVSYQQVDRYFLCRKQPSPVLSRSRSSLPPGDQSLPPGYYEPMPVTMNIPSPIPLRLQSDRKPLTLPNQPHESRFLSVPLISPFSSKYPRNSVPDMSKTLPRKEHVVPSFSQLYDANKEFVMQDLGHSLSFRRMSPRKPLFKPISDQVDPYDIVYSQVLPRTSSKDFSKMCPKDRNPGLPLPSFMQDSTSRISLGSLNAKMIQMNCTRESLLSPKLSPREKLRLMNNRAQDSATAWNYDIEH